MKQAIKTILVSILAIGVLFTLFAFANWDINPLEWGAVNRTFFTFLSAVIIVTVLSINNLIEIK